MFDESVNDYGILGEVLGLNVHVNEFLDEYVHVRANILDLDRKVDADGV